MPTINNIEFLTLPQQVQKNKRDVATLQTEAADKAVSIADEFNNLHIRLNSLEYRADETDDVISGLVIATGDTGWIPLAISNASVDAAQTAMFIRKIGNVVSLAGTIYFSSAYIKDSKLAQVSNQYRPTKPVELTCFAYQGGTPIETTFTITPVGSFGNGNLQLTTAQPLNTRVDIKGVVYLAQ